MNCPICNIPLAIADKQGVEIDYCPKCRGIWLDRGELEKIIERSFSSGFSHYEGGYNKNLHDGHDGHPDYKYKKKKNFLSDMFDF